MVIYHIELYVDSPLARLEKAAHDIAEVTSFSKLSVVAYLLADVTLELSPTILDIKRRVKTLPDGRSLERERAIIEIENPNAITYDTFMRLYRELREMLDQSITELDTETRALVEGKYLRRATVRELAAETGLTEKAVESKLLRARRELRENVLTKLRHENT